MSLTGYTTSNGTDLSSVFLSNVGGVFENAITTNGGIISPSANITYSQGMIGYTVKIEGNTSGSTASNKTFIRLTPSFTIPNGVYLFSIYAQNSYTGSGTLTLNFFNVYLSTSNTTSQNGFGITAVSSVLLPTYTSPTVGYITGNVNYIMQNSLSQSYYLLQYLSSSATMTILSSYIQYTKIA